MKRETGSCELSGIIDALKLVVESVTVGTCEEGMVATEEFGLVIVAHFVVRCLWGGLDRSVDLGGLGFWMESRRINFIREVKGST